jgi:DNA polymerase III psi subunit
MGVDIASEHIDVIITSIEGEKERLLYVGKHNPSDGVDFLHDLVRRYNVEYCAVDAVPETHTVKRFQKTAACQVWRMQYQNTNDAAEPIIDEADGFIKINRTETLDASFTKYKLKQMILPENYTEILDGSYVKEMTALSRVQVETKNGFRNEWQGPAESDHARHADNYRSALRDIIGDDTIASDCITII